MSSRASRWSDEVLQWDEPIDTHDHQAPLPPPQSRSPLAGFSTCGGRGVRSGPPSRLSNGARSVSSEGSRGRGIFGGTRGNSRGGRSVRGERGGRQSGGRGGRGSGRGGLSRSDSNSPQILPVRVLTKSDPTSDKGKLKRVPISLLESSFFHLLSKIWLSSLWS